MTFDEPH